MYSKWNWFVRQIRKSWVFEDRTERETNAQEASKLKQLRAAALTYASLPVYDGIGAFEEAGEAAKNLKNKISHKKNWWIN